MNGLTTGRDPEYPGRSCFRLLSVKLLENGNVPDRGHCLGLFMDDLHRYGVEESNKQTRHVYHSAVLESKMTVTQQKHILAE
jgi:hypothetical protein